MDIKLISNGYSFKSLLIPFEEDEDLNSNFLLKYFSIHVLEFNLHIINNNVKLKNNNTKKNINPYIYIYIYIYIYFFS